MHATDTAGLLDDGTVAMVKDSMARALNGDVVLIARPRRINARHHHRTSSGGGGGGEVDMRMTGETGGGGGTGEERDQLGRSRHRHRDKDRDREHRGERDRKGQGQGQGQGQRSGSPTAGGAAGGISGLASSRPGTTATASASGAGAAGPSTGFAETLFKHLESVYPPQSQILSPAAGSILGYNAATVSRLHSTAPAGALSAADFAGTGTGTTAGAAASKFSRIKKMPPKGATSAGELLGTLKATIGGGGGGTGTGMYANTTSAPTALARPHSAHQLASVKRSLETRTESNTAAYLQNRLMVDCSAAPQFTTSEPAVPVRSVGVASAGAYTAGVNPSIRMDLTGYIPGPDRGDTRNGNPTRKRQHHQQQQQQQQQQQESQQLEQKSDGANSGGGDSSNSQQLVRSAIINVPSMQNLLNNNQSYELNDEISDVNEDAEEFV
jgi:hypothetical protein